MAQTLAYYTCYRSSLFTKAHILQRSRALCWDMYKQLTLAISYYACNTSVHQHNPYTHHSCHWYIINYASSLGSRYRWAATAVLPLLRIPSSRRGKEGELHWQLVLCMNGAWTGPVHAPGNYQIMHQTKSNVLCTTSNVKYINSTSVEIDWSECRCETKQNAHMMIESLENPTQKRNLTKKSAKNHKTFHDDDVTKWQHFPRYWSFVRRNHRSPVDSPHKGQWRGALMFFLFASDQTVKQKIETPVIWNDIALIMTSLQCHHIVFGVVITAVVGKVHSQHGEWYYSNRLWFSNMPEWLVIWWRQNERRHFADNILQFIFLNANCCVFIQMWL